MFGVLCMYSTARGGPYVNTGGDDLRTHMYHPCLLPSVQARGERLECGRSGRVQVMGRGRSLSLSVGLGVEDGRVRGEGSVHTSGERGGKGGGWG